MHPIKQKNTMKVVPKLSTRGREVLQKMQPIPTKHPDANHLPRSKQSAVLLPMGKLLPTPRVQSRAGATFRCIPFASRRRPSLHCCDKTSRHCFPYKQRPSTASSMAGTSRPSHKHCAPLPASHAARCTCRPAAARVRPFTAAARAPRPAPACPACPGTWPARPAQLAPAPGPRRARSRPPPLAAGT
jgi:hypothetical protein